MTWKKYPPHFILHKGSLGSWQKLICEIEDEKIYANIIEWDIEGKKGYELDIQIPEEASIIGKTINVKSLSYGKLDFNMFEKHAKNMIKKLTK